MHYSQTPYSLDEAIRLVPALAACGGHSSRSDRYEQIPTVAVIAALQHEGFQIYGLQHSSVRAPDREGFQKHLVRLRKNNPASPKVGDFVPELVLFNSHDGSCAYQLIAGIMRFICENGMVVGEKWGSIRVKHHGENTISKVIEGSYEVLETFSTVVENIEAMRQITLEEPEQEAFAKSAMALRYQDEEKAPVTPLALLAPRRHEDKGNDLWHVYNRIQENVTKGGIRGRTTDHQGHLRRATLRPINGIDGSLALNRALWTLAEEMAALKGRTLQIPKAA